MKKFAKRVLAIALALSLSACSASSENVTASSGNAAKQEDSVSSNTTENVESASEITFEECTIIDNDECAVKITGIDPDNIWGYTVNVQLENKNPEKNYMFSVESAAVNGVQADPFFATEVAPGKKANGDITFTDSSLEDKIGTFTEIEMTFRVYDSDDWTADPVVHETVSIYPYGEEKATSYVRESQASDVVLIENDKLSVIALDYEPDAIWGYTVNLYLVNKTDDEVMFSVDDASVNGYMMDPFFAKSVLPGKSTFTSISWSNSSLEDNKIDSVQEIEMRIRAYSTTNLFDGDLANEVVTLKT